jgi:hypothetical protein
VKKKDPISVRNLKMKNTFMLKLKKSPFIQNLFNQEEDNQKKNATTGDRTYNRTFPQFIQF